MNLVDLADKARLNPRAVRFYIQRGLLSPPAGLGRGRHYSREHLDTLGRIQELQAAGHSLDAIGRILAGKDVESVPPPAPESTRARPTLSAELWTRLKLIPGVELHFDATRHQPDVAQLLAVREAIRAAFATDDNARDADSNQSATADERSEI
ncbi:MAG: helix-turn-helix domain-containing protein [Planctomycetota bacterium]|nr:helix-turn-helix domain-containing protein [Planctomycetota bacterium]